MSTTQHATWLISIYVHINIFANNCHKCWHNCDAHCIQDANTVVSKQICPHEKLIFVFSTKIGYMHANIIMLRDDTNMPPCKDW